MKRLVITAAGAVEVEMSDAEIAEHLAPPPPPSLDEIVAGFVEAIQDRLDAFARTRNYDGILSACTYATSSVPKFATEGQYCVDVRDQTWAASYTIMAAVQSGQRSMPTWAELQAELPALEWPA